MHGCFLFLHSSLLTSRATQVKMHGCFLFLHSSFLTSRATQVKMHGCFLFLHSSLLTSRATQVKMHGCCFLFLNTLDFYSNIIQPHCVRRFYSTSNHCLCYHNRNCLLFSTYHKHLTICPHPTIKLLLTIFVTFLLPSDTPCETVKKTCAKFVTVLNDTSMDSNFMDYWGNQRITRKQ
jgi:hypothetical protein